MSIKDKEVINVYNYNTNVVTVTTKDRSYLFNPSENETPTMIPLTWPEIEYINANSNAFKTGTLRFDKNIEQDIYQELRITDWKNILFNEDIKNILLNPTIEGLTKILEIRSSAVFERVRGIFIHLKNEGQYDISTRVERIINVRYKELINRQIKTNITLVPKDASPSVKIEDVDELKRQNTDMQKKLLEMQKMMEKLLEEKTKQKDVVSEPIVKKSSKTPKKTSES